MTRIRATAGRVVVPASLALVLTGCLSNWILPNKAVDAELGAETAKQIESEIGLTDHATGSPLVAALGAKLVDALQPPGFEYRFAILDQPEPNAFAAPGGHVYVSRGLLALTTSEDELAGVLGHEIQHVERRHSVKQMQKDRRLGLLSLPGRIVAGIVSDDLANLVGAPFELIAAGYSRGQETEADTLGQALCARIGYQPAALASILDRMERFESIGATGARRASFFDSHPSTPDRVTHLTRRAKDLPLGAGAPLSGDREAYLAALDGLPIGANPRSGVVRDKTVLHVGLDCRVEMPAGWTIQSARDSIAAIAPGGDGVAVLGAHGAGGESDLDALASACAAELEEKHGVRPESRSATTLAGFPARALVVTDSTGKEPTHVYFVWFACEGRIYQWIGMSPESHRALVRAAIDSVAPLSQGDLDSLVETRLRIATAIEGESLPALAARTKSAWSPAEIAIANSLAQDTRLTAGQRVKVAVAEPLAARHE